MYCRRLTVLACVVALAVVTAPAWSQEGSPQTCSGWRDDDSGWQRVNFAFDSTEIIDETAFTLRCLRDTLEAHPSYTLVLEGYADKIGDDAYNARLSGRRALKVQDWLLENSTRIDPDAIRARGCGRGPSADDTVETRFISRQVTLQVFDGDGAPVRQEDACGAPREPMAEETNDRPALPTECAERVDALRPEGLNFLIATLPDPIESAFGREFDLFLAAIVRALEAHGYTADRHCLPWSRALPPDTEGAKPPSDSAPRAEFDAAQPGMMIFRKGGAPARVVLIAGETPTSGVNGAALRTSLEFASARQTASPFLPTGAARLAILGPTFSGSIPSLAAGLGGWIDGALGDAPPAKAPYGGEGAAGLCADGKARIDVVSGTATGTDNPEKLARLLGGRAGRVCYRSTAATSQRLEEVLWDEFVPVRLGLDTRRRDTKGSEDGTDGQAERRESVVVLQESSVYGEGFPERGFRVFPFPMNISTLVDEYRKDPERLGDKPEAGADFESALQLPSRTLPLRLGSRRRSRDRVPFFNQATTNSIDLVLSRTVAAIAEARTRVVAIVATSTEDKIFLAQYIKARAPNVRLATFEGDLLLAHPDLGRATRGMIVVSSHSMIEPEPHRGAEESAETSLPAYLQFASDGAHGVYKAAMALSSGKPAAGPGAGGQNGIDVWVSVVGKGSLETVKRYPTPNFSSTGPPQRPPRGWSVLFALASVVIAGLLALLALKALGQLDAFLTWADKSLVGLSQEGKARRQAAVRRLDGMIGSVAWVPPWARAATAKPDQTRRLAYVTVVLLALCIAYPLLGLPYLRFRGWPSELAEFIAFSLAVLLAAGALYLVANLVSRTVVDLHQLYEDARLGILSGFSRAWPAAVAVLVLAIAYVSTQKILDTGPLFLERSSRFAPGVNPLAPILLTAAVPLIWLLLAPRRAAALRTLPESPPEDRLAGGGRLKKVAESLDRIRRCIEPGSATPGPWTSLLFLPLFYLAFYYGDFPAPLVRGVDQPIFDWMMSLLLAVAATLCVASGLASRRLWRELSKLLDWVADCLGPNQGEAWFKEHAPSPVSAETAKDRREAAWKELCAEAVAERARLGQGQAPREPAVGDGGVETGGSAPAAVPLPAWLAHRGAAGLAEKTESEREGEFAEAWTRIVLWLNEVKAAGSGTKGEEAEGDCIGGGEPAPETAGEPPQDPTAVLAEGEAAGEPSEGAAPGNAAPAAGPDRLVLAGRFLTWQTAIMARTTLFQALWFMGFMTGGLLLLLMAISAYPFEPGSVLNLWLGVLITLGALGSVLILLQIERDDTVKKFTQATSGFTHGRNLVTRFGFLGGVPLVGLLASQFPSVGNVLLSFIKPLLQVIK